MKYCQKCGKEIMDEAVICPGCGCAVQQAAPVYGAVPGVQTAPGIPGAPESPTMATLALVFAFLIPLVGIILGAVYQSKYQSPELKSRCSTAIKVGIIFIALGIILSVVISITSAASLSALYSNLLIAGLQ
ncbi:MAG: zinc ribbon domain-containing protein [Clostridia bacterium]|nr:zinc ribbon domain-containing protein [Clostridia bacterium]